MLSTNCYWDKIRYVNLATPSVRQWAATAYPLFINVNEMSLGNTAGQRR